MAHDGATLIQRIRPLHANESRNYQDDPILYPGHKQNQQSYSHCGPYWQIWKHHCCKIFQGKPIPLTEVTMELWDKLISFLHGSYEDIEGEIDQASKAWATCILK